MGRRHLPKISPALDYAWYRLTPDMLPRPWDVAALFGRVAPLELEIGSGKGMFLAKAAASRPNHLFLGVEIGPKYASFAAATLARAARDCGGLDNARILCGDAAEVLRDFLPDASLTAVHIYFPDPWWKRAHRRRRIVRTDVVQLIERRLVTGGRLHFWTDVEEYFVAGKKTVTTSTSLSLVSETKDAGDAPPQEEDDFSTHFERRTLLHGQAVYRAEFVKTS
ncbi:MAG: tRNA (guanosine(46)-N7)-methyltransferase TrmB [Thermoguttaceae bacterium]